MADRVTPRPSLRRELEKGKAKALENYFTNVAFDDLKDLMYLAGEAKISEQTISEVYMHAAGYFLSSRTTFSNQVEGYRESLSRYFPFGGNIYFEGDSDFVNISKKHFPSLNNSSLPF